MAPPTLADIRAAAERIRPFAKRTPVMTSRSLDERAGCSLFLKCENFQRVGAFKIRGATNAVLLLSDSEASKGVVAHSSGNHAQALALAARNRSVPAYIVMPRTVPAVKKAAVEGYGGRITLCEPTMDARESEVARIQRETGAAVIHPYNDYRIMAGQGTAALELLEEVPDLDAVIAPVSGGGLMSGTSIAAKSLRPSIRVIGAEPEGADDARRSLESGTLQPSVNPRTICDGLHAGLGTLTFPILRERVERIINVSDAAVVDAMRFLWERVKIIVEPSGAIGVAVAMSGKADLAGARVGVILSGGNLDMQRLPWQA